VFGWANQLKNLINISLGLILFQFLFIVVTSLLFEDDKIEIGKKGIWNILNKAEKILSILSSIATMIGFILGLVK